jgi:proteasome beta subunit
MSRFAFPSEEDPGPDFLSLLERAGLDPFASLRGAVAQAQPGQPTRAAPHRGGEPELAHGTTVVALRFGGGVVMAGDRRATEGYSVAHRRMDKVLPADRFSGVAIAGTAGPAMEMVRLFQTQLEHYEKVEGRSLSLEGKANQLAQMVRANFPLVMSAGLVVVPLFAGWDLARGHGRIFSFDVAGGRYEERTHYAVGSGSRDARSVLKLGWREDLDDAGALGLAASSLVEAADEDAATGGVDFERQIYPSMATIGPDGFVEVDPDRIAEIFRAVLEARRRGGERP